MFNKEVLSFDIGTYSTKVVLGKGMKNKVMIKEAFTFPTPVGTVEDGQIINSLPLKEEILKNLDERGIYVNKAVFTLASTKAITRELILPFANEKKLEAMVPYELSKQLPITVDNYVIKYLLLDVFVEDKTKKAHVLVIALPKYIVKQYWDLCTELEIEPTFLTLHGVSAIGLFPPQKSVITGQPETIALIDLGHSSINCNIISKGNFVFNRIISTVGMKVSLDKLTNYDKGAKEVINKWLEEIKMILRFYYSLDSNKDVDKIILLGGSANINNITSIFEEKLERPTTILEDNEGVIYKGNNEDFSLNQYFNAVSALTLN